MTTAPGIGFPAAVKSLRERVRLSPDQWLKERGIYIRIALFFIKAERTKHIHAQRSFRFLAERYKTLANRTACVAWRFWLGAQSNKGGEAARSRAFLRLHRSVASAPYKTATLRRLTGRQRNDWSALATPPNQRDYKQSLFFL